MKVSAHWVARMQGCICQISAEGGQWGGEMKQIRVGVCTDLFCSQGQPQSFFGQNNNAGWDMAPSLWSRDKMTEYGLETCQFSHPKETLGYPICWQSHDCCFLGTIKVLYWQTIHQKVHRVTYYYDKLCVLYEALKSKRRGKLRRGTLLLLKNAPAHTSCVAMSATAECSCKLLHHTASARSSTLWLIFVSTERTKQFSSNNDVIVSAEDFLRGKMSSSTRLEYRNCSNDGISALKFTEIFVEK